MNNKKQNILLLVISLLVLVIGISYAYYSAVVQGTGNANAEASGKTATIGEVEFNGENTFDTTNIGRDIYPGFIGVQEFTISPYKDGTGIYEIDLAATVPESFGSDIKLTIYKTSDKTNNNIESEEGTLTITNNQYTKQDILTINGVLEKVYEKSLTTTTETMIEQVVFAIENNAFTTPSVTPDGYFTYYAVYEYLDNGNQNEQQGLDFEGKITVKYVSDTELSAAAYISSLAGNSPKNSVAIIDKGTMYDTDGETEICTNTLAYDDFGNLRYVGENPCNYVTFNGEEPSLVEAYQAYLDGTITDYAGYFDSEEECLEDIESWIRDDLGIDSLSCTLNSSTNKYEVTGQGYLKKLGKQTSEESCLQAVDDYGIDTTVDAVTCKKNGTTTSGGWRIIGVLDNQIKLIRNESIGEYSWDTSASNINNSGGINQWGKSEEYTGADLMKLLNPGYDTNLAEDASGNTIAGTYANNSLYWNRGTGNCYNASKNAYATCNFSATGLTESAKTMIDKHTWNLGSNDGTTYTYNNIKAKAFYELERSNNTGKLCTSSSACNDTVNRTTNWEGYVGLMYPSDYGYAVGGEARESCLANINLWDYGNNICSINDWLINQNWQWTMLPYADSSIAFRVFVVRLHGSVHPDAARFDCTVRPTLFLIPSITISGSGTPNDPFVLSMD